ncbi:MAG: threonine synthase [Bacteroidales bacterium]|nr:threonine synthase [Bacteroidales bacterium]
MRFYNINDRKETATFREAVLQGAAGGNGLYFPISLTAKDGAFFDEIDNYSFTDLATEVLYDFVKEDFTRGELQDICGRAFNFSLPLAQVDRYIYVLELFHGPSLAFKDVGARFLAEVLKKIAEKAAQEITVLVATSGDTGSAVAKSFYNVQGIRVVLLYPSGKVSPLQEKTLTTLGGNITAVEVQGTFDDCQKLVKRAFADQESFGGKVLTSANSINVGRLLPQMVYYFWAWRQLENEQRDNMIFSVPSGNYGNLTAGVMAWKMGLPVKRFVAASNINRVVPDYLQTGQYNPRTAVRTHSNAMDVGDPSNFVRIREMFGDDHKRISQLIQGFVVNDEQTAEAIRDLHNKTGYILDPHGAIGYMGCRHHLQEGETGVFLETAHPAKFPDVVEEAIGESIDIPIYLKEIQNKEKQALQMPADYKEFRQWLSGHVV